MQTQRVQTYPIWNMRLEQRCEVHKQILAGGLEGKHHKFSTFCVVERRALRHHKGVVEGLDDMFLCKPFDVAEIHYHAALRTVIHWSTLHGDKQLVVVAVNVTAFPVIAPQSVGHLEVELFSKT